MRAGGEAEDENPRIRVSKTGHRLAPIFPFAVSAALFARDLLPIDDQARAKIAGDNFLVEDVEPVRRGHDSRFPALCITPVPPTRLWFLAGRETGVALDRGADASVWYCEVSATRLDFVPLLGLDFHLV